jgi:anti-sigma factor RsiW
MAIYCHDLDTLLPPYLDGELEGHELDDLEHHLGTCAACQARCEHETSDHARLRELLAAPPAPAALRAGVLAALDREDRSLVSGRRSRWGWALPGAASLAAAAALAVFVLDGSQPAIGPVAPPQLSVATMQREAVASRLRAAPLVRTSSSTDLTRSVAEYLRVPVTAPRLEGSSMRGWQPTQLAGRMAAKLVYEVTTGRQRYLVDVHLLDGRDMDLDAGQRVRVDDVDLSVSSTGGIHTIAFKDARGVGYVFSSDMPRGSLIDLVVSSRLVDQVNDRVFGD